MASRPDFPEAAFRSEPIFSHLFRLVFLSVENWAGVGLVRDLAELVVDDRTPTPDLFFPLSFAIRLVPQITQFVEVGHVYAPAPTLVELDDLSFASAQAETSQADRRQIVERDFFIKVAQRLQFAVGEWAAFFARLVF